MSGHLRLGRAFWCCGLVLLLSMPLAEALSSKPIRTGLWTNQRLPEDERTLQAFADDVNKSRDLSGVCFHIAWNEIEKEKGSFDFSQLDKAVAVMRRKKMPYQLVLKPGATTPAFVFAEGARALTTTITNPHRSNVGSSVTIPIPWDPIYEKEFSKMIAELGRHYSSDPLCVSVVLTCANYLSAEMHLPKTPADLAKWESFPNYGEKLLGVYNRYTDEWAQAFPRQEISLHISKVLRLPQSFNERIIDNGLKKYPERFTIQNCQLTGRREDVGRMSYDLVMEYRDRAHHGFQSLAALHDSVRMGSLEMAVLNVVHGRGEYWELWHGDGFDPQTCAAVARAWSEARRLGYEGYKEKLKAENKYRE